MNNKIIQSLIARGREPSTWSSLAAGLAGLGFAVPSQWVQVISYIGCGLCMLAGILIPENKNPTAQ